jgi:hypothetical protein
LNPDSDGRRAHMVGRGVNVATWSSATACRAAHETNEFFEDDADSE